jgi:hypothetical protein
VVGYELYRWHGAKGYDLIGILPERRNDPQRVTKESVLNWGQKYFGVHLNLGETYLVEVDINREAIRPVIKKVNVHHLMKREKRQG